MKVIPLEAAHITATHMQMTTNPILIVGYPLDTIVSVLRNYGFL